MTLASYLVRPGALSRSELAQKMGVSRARLSQLRDSTDWPPELALRAEKVTHGAICASDLSPIIAQARAA